MTEAGAGMTPVMAIALVGVLGVGAQWLAWRLKLPAIVLMLLAGILIGPVTGIFDPERDIGDLTEPFISIAVAVILFEGGLTLSLGTLKGVAQGVRRLVLIEPVFFTAAYRADPAFEAEQMAKGSEVYDSFRAKDYRSAARAFLRDWGGGQPFDAMSPVQQDQFVEQMKLVEAVYVTNNGDPDGMLGDGLVARLPMPVLLIDGAESPEGSHRIVQALDDLIPDSRLVTIPGAAHMVPITHADSVGPLVAEFLA